MQWNQRLSNKLRDLGWSIPDLAAKMGRAGDVPLIEKLYKYVGGKVEHPRGRMVADIAAAIGLSEAELRGTIPLTIAPKIPVPTGTEPEQNASIGVPIDLSHRVPLMGRGMGGKDGAIIFNADENLGTVAAPPGLRGVPKAYAVYVVGNSMLDRYAQGEVVYVDPRLTPHKGDYVVAQIAMGDGEPDHGYVKRFISLDDKKLKLEQLNPRKFLTFPRTRVRAVHVIVMGGKG